MEGDLKWLRHKLNEYPSTKLSNKVKRAIMSICQDYGYDKVGCMEVISSALQCGDKEFIKMYGRRFYWNR